ncbi:hypothetical protein H6P81_011516 [Aristolochia fimbriata]|uniref:Uncharacterized protein n=1 Tax=Aristolochia fimbriata TaxID=158543 RepID=A0AAV7ESU9_ARIFI|nr:hypothetical protein H6P81_011516 [Aristolochia fimbriata]
MAEARRRPHSIFKFSRGGTTWRSLGPMRLLLSARGYGIWTQPKRTRKTTKIRDGILKASRSIWKRGREKVVVEYDQGVYDLADRSCRPIYRQNCITTNYVVHTGNCRFGSRMVGRNGRGGEEEGFETCLFNPLTTAEMKLPSLAKITDGYGYYFPVDNTMSDVLKRYPTRVFLFPRNIPKYINSRERDYCETAVAVCGRRL